MFSRHAYLTQSSSTSQVFSSHGLITSTSFSSKVQPPQLNPLIFIFLISSKVQPPQLSPLILPQVFSIPCLHDLSLISQVFSIPCLHDLVFTICRRVQRLYSAYLTPPFIHKMIFQSVSLQHFCMVHHSTHQHFKDLVTSQC